MFDDLDRGLKDVFPPTPASFTGSVEKALKALPSGKARWKLPVVSVAAYALAACAVFALGFGVIYTGGLAKNSPPASAAPTQAPPKGPVWLRVTYPDELKSSDGWQVTAIQGGVKWFYNPKTQMVARERPEKALAIVTNPSSGKVEAIVTSAVELTPGAQTKEGEPLLQRMRTLLKSSEYTPVQTANAIPDEGRGSAEVSSELYNQFIDLSENRLAVYALDLPQGDSVNPYSFLPDEEGRWVAFTVHGSKGDSVWVVSKAGRKMSVPEDVQWVDSLNNPVAADFSGGSMIAYGSDKPSFMPSADGNTNASDTLMIEASYPGQENYVLHISLNNAEKHDYCLLDDRRGICFPYLEQKTGVTFVTGMGFLGRIIQEGGKYSLNLGGMYIPTDLQSDRFALFRMPRQNDTLFPTKAIFIYADDAEHTLRELDVATGKTTQIASGCLAAGWEDHTSYWYAAKSDGTKVFQRETANDGDVNIQVSMSESFSSANGNAKAGIAVHVIIQNLSDQEIKIPAKVPCSLRMNFDGKTIWSKEQLTLADINDLNIVKPGIGDSMSVQWPAVVPPGYVFEFWLPEIECTARGEYVLDGSFNGKTIRCETYVGDMYGQHSGVDIQGTILADGQLGITLENRSRATFTLLQSGDQYKRILPVVCYRLLSAGKIVDEGRMQMTGDGLPSSNVNIPPGEKFTLTEKNTATRFSQLPAGQYTLECYLAYFPDTGNEYKGLPWGLNYGYYFDVPFTVPSN